jgi:hypothetical protein
MRKIIITLLVFSLATLACSFTLSAPQQATATLAANTPAPAVATQTAVASDTVTPAATPSETQPPSQTPTASQTPTLTATPGPSATATFNFPSVTVNMQAHCRYGPNVAYLHAADLYAGDVGTVRGRFRLSKWLFVKFDKLNYFCWVAPSVVDVVGDITTIKFTEVYLPGPSVLYKAPHNVVAVRNGNKVTITWDMVPMTTDDDRGYFLDIFVCQGKGYLWYPVTLANRDVTSFTIKDEAGCPVPSGGKLYAVEKHGYTKPVEINWPKP